LAFAYRVQIEKYMGAALPPMKDADGEDTTMPPQVEAQLAPLLAGAAQKLLQNNQAEAAQQQAQQQAQDPVIQMQMQELQQNEREIARKENKDKADIMLRQQELMIKTQQVEQAQEAEGAKIGAKVSMDKAKIDSTEKIEGAKMGIDISKSKEKLDVQRELAGVQHGVEILKHHTERADQKAEADAQRAQADKEAAQQAAMAEKAATAQQPKKGSE
jgi:hypothetical protein